MADTAYGLKVYVYLHPPKGTGETVGAAGDIGLGAAANAGVGNATPMTNAEAANLVAQTAAWGADQAGLLGALTENPYLGYTQAVVSAAALQTSSSVLVEDFNKGETLHVVGDVVEMLGDSVQIAGGLLAPLGPASAALEVAGGILTAIGLGLETADAIDQVPASVVTALESFVNKEINTVESAISTVGDDIASGLSALWSSAQNALTGDMSAVSGALAEYGTPSFSDDISSAQNTINNSSQDFGNLFYGEGGGEDNINISSSGSNVTTADTQGNITSDTTSIESNDVGSIILNSVGTNGIIQRSETASIDNDGNLADTVTSYNQIGEPLDSTATYAGGYADTVYSTDPSGLRQLN